jgi:BT1 family
LGAIVMHWLGITEKNFESLWLLVVIANVSTLLPLPFLNWLPAVDSQSTTGTSSLAPGKEIEKPFIPEFLPELAIGQPESKPAE